MHIAIISDTHDNTPAIVWIIEYLNQNKIEVALHAGDIISPGVLQRFEKYYTGHLHFVFGNNDGEQALAERKASLAANLTCHLFEMRLELASKRIFMNHYSSISETIAKSGDFDLCIGGHDHIYRSVEHGQSIFLNPGNTTTKDKWSQQNPGEESSFAIVDLTTMKIERILLPE